MGFCRFTDVLIGIEYSFAHVAQLAERVLGKDEVISSILIMGSSVRSWQINIKKAGACNGKRSVSKN